MVEKLIPELNQVYFINQYTAIHILKGNGGIQVDFKNYFDWQGKLIFLDKGQYIKFLAEGFEVRKIEFEDQELYQSNDVRVLFKHLVSLGYINFDDCMDCQRFLGDTVFSKKTHLIDISTRQWYRQNPFQADPEEYHLIFSVKDIIDREYKNRLTNQDFIQLIDHPGMDAHALYSNKVGITIKKLLGKKRLTEGQKKIAFTDQNIQEVSYELGYKDPAYFNRVFKNETGQTPMEFRRNMGDETHESMIQDLLGLLQEFHTGERQAGFYADALNVSIPTLSKKVKDKLQTSLGRLIRQMLVQTAKDHLENGLPVKEVAFLLGFEEANHFSTFFKHNTQLTPTAFKKKKYKD